jgi:hypothetical protein
MPQDHWLAGFNFNVEEWFEGDRCETLAIYPAPFSQSRSGRN